MNQTLRVPALLGLVVALSLIGVRVLWELSPTPARAASASSSAVSTVTPTVASADAVTAALAERAALAREQAASRSAAERARKVWPAAGALTGWWGEPRGGRLHLGVDIDGETGDEIYAMSVGVVSHAGPAMEGYGGYGNMVIIDHDGYQTLYAHLSRVDVKVGTPVVAGQIIGLMGTSGNVTGSHLHFEARVNGQQIDPRQVLPARQ